jgi:hypothetical protein
MLYDEDRIDPNRGVRECEQLAAHWRAKLDDYLRLIGKGYRVFIPVANLCRRRWEEALYALAVAEENEAAGLVPYAKVTYHGSRAELHGECTITRADTRLDLWHPDTRTTLKNVKRESVTPVRGREGGGRDL